jgi:hypothetical protein
MHRKNARAVFVPSECGEWIYVPTARSSGSMQYTFSAWLNMPRAVEVLLECSAGRMSVDGTDSLGATPLMCSSLLSLFTSTIYNATADAARDGNLAVVKLLVS